MSVAIEHNQLAAIHQFAQSAEAYCALMETSETMTRMVFVRHTAAMLAMLYHDALDLPDQLDEDCEESQVPTIPDQEIYARIRQHLGQRDFYFMHFDPYDQSSNMYGQLSDDLGDIYRDLSKGLYLYRLGTDCSALDAAFTWKLIFSYHWGQHLVNALTALHAIISQNLLADDEQSD